MIQRHQRIVFWCLVVCILGMGLLLFWERQRARDRVSQLADNTPIDAPYTTTESITMDLASDDDGTITAQQRQIALPSEVTARARALLDHLAAEYAQPGSVHPLSPGAMVDDVYFVPLPVVGYSIDAGAKPSADGNTPTSLVPPDPDALQPQSPGDELAVINLRGSFVNAHPSGVEVEQLTLQSIIGTLHANLPQIEQVRFLVDGQPRETLAGHADLLRLYMVRDTTTTAAGH
ncbi:Sporulation and spore germination [Bryocella elongata]|uniref:Sporulation and spore germination n=1 Tax=Bryocella elongata TaxID=863522 RepID=A0A1H5U3X8_9BACT|nr:GerMN domain-containing protein [Bryocella elongata]SEF68941.1 Sporulation and spore germination [Bryocella elongata]